MEPSEENFPSKFRKLILNTDIHEPIVFKGIHKDWEPVYWDTERWRQLFVQDGVEKKLRCRVGVQNFESNEPQWESLTKATDISWSDLVTWHDERQWAYYDYKNIIQVFDESHFKDFEWSKLGFPERNGEHSNVWIGTQGSYTPCHFDTYGCNLVCQVRGRKTWLMFPPDDTKYLRPTRIPYEESSVYSEINFLNISDAHLEGLVKCTPVKVTLEPGDVLFVPPKWWHFVRSEEFTISVNTWIELNQDRKSRIEEALVRFMVGSIVSLATPDSTIDILNPNEEDLTEAVEDELEQMLKNSCDDFLKHTEEGHTVGQPNMVSIDSENYVEPESKKRKLSGSLVIDDLLHLHQDVGGQRLENFYFQKRPAPRRNVKALKIRYGTKRVYLRHFINAIGNPSVLKHISEQFIRNVSEEEQS